MSGWVKIHGVLIVKAIQEANLPHDGQMLLDCTYAPRWIKEAVDLFYKGDGYADMSLTEYLRRINIERDETRNL